MSLVADIFLCSMIDDSGNIIATSTLQSGSIEVSVQENDVKAGRGNSLIAVLHSDRDVNIALTDALFRYDWLAKQLGQSVLTGAGVAWAMEKTYTCIDSTGTIKITLDEEPLASDSGLKIFKTDGTEIVKTSGYTISGKNVTLLGGIAAGTLIVVKGYKFNTSASTQSITIDNSIFADGVICVLETLEIDRDETPTHKIQYIFDECLPSGSFTIDTTSERTASAQTFNLRVIRPAHTNVIGKVLRIPISA